MNYTKIEQTTKLPIKSCIVNSLFTDALDATYHRQKYCKFNCGFRCQLDKTACYQEFQDITV